MMLVSIVTDEGRKMNKEDMWQMKTSWKSMKTEENCDSIVTKSNNIIV